MPPLRLLALSLLAAPAAALALPPRPAPLRATPPRMSAAVGRTFALRVCLGAAGAISTAVILPVAAAVRRRQRKNEESLEMLRIACAASGTGDEEACRLAHERESWWGLLTMDELEGGGVEGA
mmetsp:Transcript_30484/g.74160  ORF Transcript_30484/g.74160 Transcript_30484/m.74160 type:complete len:123 (-) Transcript_30484:507-875(-)